MVGSRLYVGNLPKIANERDLERFFKGFGRVREVLIKTGYGFVELDDPRDAEDALYELNGKRLLGERVTVERARGTPRGRDQWAGHRDNRQYYSRNNYHNNYHNNHHNNHYNNHHNNHNGNSNNNDRFGPPTRTDHRLIVENLSSRCSWQDLKDYMRQAGEVTYADAHKYKNEGVVEFASYSEMKNALEKLDDTDLNGRRIHLIEDKPKRGRKSLSYSSRSRSRSRSQRKSATPSPSRSRSGSKLLARNPSNPSKSPLKAYTNGNRSQSPPAPMRKSIAKSKSRSRSNSVKSNQSTDLSSKSRSLSPTTD